MPSLEDCWFIDVRYSRSRIRPILFNLKWYLWPVANCIILGPSNVTPHDVLRAKNIAVQPSSLLVFHLRTNLLLAGWSTDRFTSTTQHNTIHSISLNHSFRWKPVSAAIQARKCGYTFFWGGGWQGLHPYNLRGQKRLKFGAISTSSDFHRVGLCLSNGSPRSLCLRRSNSALFARWRHFRKQYF